MIWHFLLNILILSLAIFLVAKLMPAIRLKNFGTAILVALGFSLINVCIGWFLTLISLPLIFITFGLFKLVINAFMLWLTDAIIDDFEINGIGPTLLAAFLITVIDSILKFVIF